MSTSIEILRDSTATATSPELVVGITDMPTAQFDQLAERLLAEPPHPSVTPPQTEVWPLITAKASTFATGGGTAHSDAPGPAGLNLNAALNPRYAGSGRFSDGPLRALSSAGSTCPASSSYWSETWSISAKPARCSHPGVPV